VVGVGRRLEEEEEGDRHLEEEEDPRLGEEGDHHHRGVGADRAVAEVRGHEAKSLSAEEWYELKGREERK
jgi:hypothetical protein